MAEKEKKLNKLKAEEKIKNFEECISRLKSKNSELEELVNQSKLLQLDKFETENKINSYNSKIKKYTEEINSINEKYKYNQKELENNQSEIAYLEECKEKLKLKEIILNKDEKQNINNYKEKIEKNKIN